MPDIRRHLAALSPYLNIPRQPPAPVAHPICGAVYLFRHGVIEVSHNDHDTYIRRFLDKLHRLQRSQTPFATGTLGFLLDYVSWITDSHVGLVSFEGYKQSAQLGRAFRQRYSRMLKETSSRSRSQPILDVWCDDASRCRAAAAAFATSFSGEVVSAGDVASNRDSLPRCHVRLQKIHVSPVERSINNLGWHHALNVDQSVGQRQMDEAISMACDAALSRLVTFWTAVEPLTAVDVYSMMILHGYDIVSGRISPFEDLFHAEDWSGFEYIRDVKYFYCEGYGRESVHLLAVPWMQAVMDVLCKTAAALASETQPSNRGELPLKCAFTHREEILYLACLLGLSFRQNWQPSLTAIDQHREWRVADLAPYLGHVGIEAYPGESGQLSIRVIVNGECRRAFFNEIEPDESGGYNASKVLAWLDIRRSEYDAVYGAGDLTFMRDVL